LRDLRDQGPSVWSKFSRRYDSSASERIAAPATPSKKMTRSRLGPLGVISVRGCSQYANTASSYNQPLLRHRGYADIGDRDVRQDGAACMRRPRLSGRGAPAARSVAHKTD
jgi:hypothetical protein